jgi:predicted ArsR family transcriptional regulator
MAAADAIGASLNALQRSVVSFLRTRGDHGATDEEIAVGLQMNPSTARPRRIELVRRGLVVEAGTRKAMSGRYATAWRLA